MLIVYRQCMFTVLRIRMGFNADTDSDLAFLVSADPDSVPEF